ncbi:MAG TPA: Fur family transcriptional regulator [Candidatus Cybelea sp.]|nr:Fur family transcriptional regulator [Candidatus Cybelea sp.]
MKRKSAALPAPAFPSPAFPPHAHDHAHCIDDALLAADRICAGRGARLTELRRHVLAILWRSHEPIGAYDVLERLARETRRRAAPPTVYRALEFLLGQGLIHRVESRNAFIGCTRPDMNHAVEILMCTACGRAAEVPDSRIARAVRNSAATFGFEVQRQTIEVSGVCADCRTGDRRG